METSFLHLSPEPLLKMANSRYSSQVFVDSSCVSEESVGAEKEVAAEMEGVVIYGRSIC